ncbi:MAG: DUF1570 domain-containing protein [Phycisphaerae bacterium]|jgi:hypothetical protein|nr:DUF1570 domain-containing protein [Phycisphaerae bacterium]
MRHAWFTGILIAAVTAGICTPCSAEKKKLPQYATKYYILHTDLDKDMTREAVVRINAMAEEYYNRTKSFAGRINTRLPFYLYKNRQDYLDHPGVVEGSAGVYNGRSLVAVAPRPGGGWRVVQHEGFHQFAHKMIRGRLPTWLNEGLADYFGAGVWTGDSLVVGVISPGSLTRVRNMIKGGKLMPLDKMLNMDQKTWNNELKSSNYLQAWSMVHFLVHADKGKYQKALSGFIRDLSQSRSVSAAFRKRFGNNVKAFQACYAKWWSKLDDNPSADLYDRIKVLTLTSFLARAHGMGGKFENIDEFVKAAHDGRFAKALAKIGKHKPDIWLPVSLLKRNLPSSREIGRWSLLESDRGPRLKYTRSDGTALIGGFKLGDRIRVKVKTVRPESEKPTVKPAIEQTLKK